MTTTKFKDIINNIENCNFEPVEDRENTCKYCGYKEFCNMNIV